MAEGNGGGGRGMMIYWPIAICVVGLAVSWGEMSSRGAAINDRVNAQRQRLDQHDMQFADINRAMGENARLIATLTERMAGYATADSPRMRQLEAEVAELRGRMAVLNDSVAALREYVVRQGEARAAQPPPGRQ